MKINSLCLVLLATVCACTQTSQDTGSAAFVTKLGNDTLVVEQFEKTETGMRALVVLRTPRTSFTSYELSLDETGGMQRFTMRLHPRDQGFDGEGKLVQTVEKKGDSLIVESQTEEGIQRRAIEHEDGVLPFIDMVHWPFELALRQADQTGRDSVVQRMLTGPRLSDFVIARIRKDSMTVRHPYRGVMGVDVNDRGELLFLDAGLTTRKLKVQRVQEIDIDAIGKRFSAMDERGNPFGELSGAEVEEASFRGVNYRVEYGTPMKRGRAIFGGIVPWGEWWRTGANRATHFSTSRDLRIGDLTVPAGEYTLFTIPEPDGGTLIINKQTGQNGQSYDAARDLGRVPMEISSQAEVTEKFTISVEETASGGVLKLIWDQTVFSVDFEII